MRQNWFLEKKLASVFSERSVGFSRHWLSYCFPNISKSPIMRWTIGILVITLTLSWSSVCSQSAETESLTSSQDTLKKTEGEIAAKPKKQQQQPPAAPAKQSYSSLLTGIHIKKKKRSDHNYSVWSVDLKYLSSWVNSTLNLLKRLSRTWLKLLSIRLSLRKKSS